MQGVGCMAYGAGRRVQGVGCRVWGIGCRVQGRGCRVQDVWCVVYVVGKVPASRQDWREAGGTGGLVLTTRSESKMLSLQSFLRKGASLGYGGLN